MSIDKLMTRILALDVGDRRIGVALSDPLGILASPLTIIERQDDDSDIQSIINLASKHQVQKIIVGLPLSMDGMAREQAAKVKSFIQKLEVNFNAPLEYRDERLTTVSARRLMESARTKKGKPKQRDDAIAAAIILQSYLDEKQ